MIPGDIPLYLAPGHQCDARIFAPQITALGLEGAAVAEHRLDADFSSMAARLLRTAPPRFAAIGFSLGGMLVLELMAQAPDRLLGAALIGADAEPAPRKEIEWRESVFDAVRAEGEPALVRLGEWLNGRFFGHSPKTLRRLGPEFLAMRKLTDAATFLRQGAALSGRRNRLEALASFARSGRPVSLIVGREDRLCPLENHRRMKAAAPEATLLVIESCGHFAMLEYPEIVNASLKGWLEAL